MSKGKHKHVIGWNTAEEHWRKAFLHSVFRSKQSVEKHYMKDYYQLPIRVRQELRTVFYSGMMSR